MRISFTSMLVLIQSNLPRTQPLVQRNIEPLFLFLSLRARFIGRGNLCPINWATTTYCSPQILSGQASLSRTYPLHAFRYFGKCQNTEIDFSDYIYFSSLSTADFSRPNDSDFLLFAAAK